MRVLILFAFVACSGATPQEKSQAAESTFSADMLACIEKSDTKSESQDCRAKVREKWHVDGGAK